MRRSEVNSYLQQAQALFAEYRFELPPWATWSAEEWRRHPDVASHCSRHQMGWDITDFGFGRFAEEGLVLFCVRNGIQGDPTTVPYAEKLLVVREDQSAPFHYHKVKMEDIIVRGGGNLIIELYNTGVNGEELDAPVTALLDGMRRTVAPREPVRLTPGQSITLPRGLMHRLAGEKGRGMVFLGEVSQVNDDLNDNFFEKPVGRFAKIEEDEPPLFPLWNELAKLSS
ncbi:MAG: D-lyxose/D-mannose family sugar isomerase [Methylobacteriaceae bacterium]|nr:D-lyxose/D-mannose family sugar isomerase [Methylobacteriaceae bacterium]